MVDVDALERLARLRDQGVLTAEEFENEKAKLLQQREEYQPSYDYEEPPRRTGKIIGAVLAVLLVGGAAAALFAGGLIEGNPVAPVADSLTGDGWRFSDTTDPMTDEKVAVASRRIDAGDYVVNAKITCTGSAKPEYEFGIFTHKNDGAVIDTKMGLYGLYREFEYRLDSGQLESAETRSRYSNVISTSRGDSRPSLFDEDEIAQRMAAARKILIKVPLEHSDLTFEVPQSGGDIRQFLDGCHKVVSNANSASSEQEQMSQPVDENASALSGQANESTEEDGVSNPPNASTNEGAVQRNADGSFDVFANRE